MECEVGPLTLSGGTVTVAHTADLDTEADLTPRWLGYVGSTSLSRQPARTTCAARIFAVAVSQSAQNAAPAAVQLRTGHHPS